MKRGESVLYKKKFCKYCKKDINAYVYFCSLTCELLHTKLMNNQTDFRRRRILSGKISGENQSS